MLTPEPESAGGGWKQAIKTGGAIVVVVIAVGWLGWRIRSGFGPTTTDNNRVVIVCTACDQETRMTSQEANVLAGDEETGAFICPQCQQPAAWGTSLRCFSCKRYIPRTPEIRSGAYECPYCKTSLAAQVRTPSGGG